MPIYIKEGISEEASFAADMKVKEIVEGILNDIRNRGDEAVRDLSIATVAMKQCVIYPSGLTIGTQRASN